MSTLAQLEHELTQTPGGSSTVQGSATHKVIDHLLLHEIPAFDEKGKQINRTIDAQKKDVLTKTRLPSPAMWSIIETVGGYLKTEFPFMYEFSELDKKMKLENDAILADNLKREDEYKVKQKELQDRIEQKNQDIKAKLVAAQTQNVAPKGIPKLEKDRAQLELEKLNMPRPVLLEPNTTEHYLENFFNELQTQAPLSQDESYGIFTRLFPIAQYSKDGQSREEAVRVAIAEYLHEGKEANGIAKLVGKL